MSRIAALLSRLSDPGNHGLAASIGLLVLRIAAGAQMVSLHGWGKLSRFAEKAPKFPDPLGIGSEASLAGAVTGEVLAAGLITLGFYTRGAAIPAAFTMAVAAFLHHTGDPWKDRELAFFYLAAYVAVGLLGPGRFSVDALRR
jgi:putative oxidoreductase